MSVKKILFIGGYPNEVHEYRNVFFQNLVFALADMEIECTVISPVSYTKYRKNIFKIKKATVDTTPKGSKIHVYYPRYITYSAKKIGMFNTGILSEQSFESCVVAQAKRLNKTFDCVYGHFFLMGGLAAIKVGNMLDIPSFVAYGECDYESQIRVLYRDLKQKDVDGLRGVVSVSTKNTDELNATGLFKDIPITTCVNAVDLTSFKKKDKKECRKRFGLPEDKFIVGFVGYFIKRKGPERVIEACERIDGAYVALAGRGENKPQGERVLFAEALPHEDICDFLNAVDVFVLPTLSEGCCNSVLEAMASGTPVISSDLPFNWDVLNKTNSILVDPMNIDDIEKAIRVLKNNKEKRDYLSENCLSTAKELSIDRRAERIIEFINGSMITSRAKGI